MSRPSSPGGVPVIPATVVARVKLPPTVVFDVLRALNENMTRYESTFGEIQRVEPRPSDGDDTGGGDAPDA